MPKLKFITKRLNKTCAVCGRSAKIIFYNDRSYRGGHYFGKVPFYTEKELRRADKAGTKPWKLGNAILQVMKVDPKPYKHEEYWECPKCYWN